MEPQGRAIPAPPWEGLRGAARPREGPGGHSQLPRVEAAARQPPPPREALRLGHWGEGPQGKRGDRWGHVPSIRVPEMRGSPEERGEHPKLSETAFLPPSKTGSERN